MNKFFYKTSVMAVATAAFFLVGCGNADNSHLANNEEKLQIITTIFPEYDWVNQILGEDAEHAEVTMLFDKGVDLHNYQPTASDMMKISKCDMFIYVGGESDEWVEDALKEASNTDRKVINLLEVLGDSVKEEEVVEGMEVEAHDEHEEHEYDEHVWLSLKNAKIFCNEIADQLSEIDADNAETYKTNVDVYTAKLDELDVKYQTVVDAASKNTILVGDRFPFRYLVDDYGLNYYAAFVGCSAETEASFDTITFLAGKVDELNLNKVFTIEKSDQKIAKTIIENTESKNQKILSLDSMQSMTLDDMKNGGDYLSIMESNLEKIKEAIQ